MTPRDRTELVLAGTVSRQRDGTYEAHITTGPRVAYGRGDTASVAFADAIEWPQSLGPWGGGTERKETER